MIKMNQTNKNIISTSGLIKTYRRYKKPEGIRGSIASLFHREYEEKTAVNRIDQIGRASCRERVSNCV